ncbi:MAG: phytanoyl-CoA dioxygenase family protein [Actinomycetota bacterium]
MNTVSLHNLARKLPVVRSATFTSPPYHVGSVLENRLGLQVCRVISKQIVKYFRPKFLTEEIKQFVEVLERDGVLVMENFLDSEQFDKVRAEFEKANEGISLTAYKNAENAKLYRTQLQVSNSPELFPSIRNNFQENPFLEQIASEVISRRITNKPNILLDTYQNLNDNGIDNDIENILHADLHTPTVKMFFYLNKVDETNGAFIYAKGSHKLTAARLLHEYELSIREAKLNQGLPIPESQQAKRGNQIRNIISPKNWRRMNVQETQICVEPNTLVITNNMGFHRRGEFTGSEPRKALLINYRNAEKSFW